MNPQGDVEQHPATQTGDVCFGSVTGSVFSFATGLATARFIQSSDSAFTLIAIAVVVGALIGGIQVRSITRVEKHTILLNSVSGWESRSQSFQVSFCSAVPLDLPVVPHPLG